MRLGHPCVASLRPEPFGPVAALRPPPCPSAPERLPTCSRNWCPGCAGTRAQVGRNTHQRDPSPLTPDQLMPYLGAPIPQCQLQSEHQRKIMRLARSSKRRHLLLDSLERPLPRGHSVGLADRCFFWSGTACSMSSWTGRPALSILRQESPRARTSRLAGMAWMRRHFIRSRARASWAFCANLGARCPPPPHAVTLIQWRDRDGSGGEVAVEDQGGARHWSRKQSLTSVLPDGPHRRNRDQRVARHARVGERGEAGRSRGLRQPPSAGARSGGDGASTTEAAVRGFSNSNRYR